MQLAFQYVVHCQPYNLEATNDKIPERIWARQLKPPGCLTQFQNSFLMQKPELRGNLCNSLTKLKNLPTPLRKKSSIQY